MFELIEKIRQKPDRTKKHIAFLIALFLSGTIFIIWLSVIYPDFKNNQIKEETVSKLEPSPLDTFGKTFSDGISAIGEQIGKLKETITGISSDLTSYQATSSLSVSTTTISTPKIPTQNIGTSTNPTPQLPVLKIGTSTILKNSVATSTTLATTTVEFVQQF